MGDNTAIEWADATWNPIIGCSRVGPGCDHCYAIGVVHRAMSPQHVGLTVHPEGGPTDWTGEVRPVPHMFDQPSRWSRPRRIFVNSLSDLFHPEMLEMRDGQFPLLARLVAEMVANPRHTFQVLTKRPQIMAEVLGHPMFRLDVNAVLLGLGHEVMPGGMSEPGFEWPRHIWWGTSIETDRYTFRANHLRLVNGVRWISAEPLLGPLPSLDLTGIDWVVAGGESGPGMVPRPMHPDWVRDLRDRCILSAYVQCDECERTGYNCAAHGGRPGINYTPPTRTAFLFKQWGNWVPMDDPIEPEFESKAICIESDGTNVAWLHTPLDDEAVTLVNVGKKAAGRMLDGRTWDEYPGASPLETADPYLARTVCVPQSPADEEPTV